MPSIEHLSYSSLSLYLLCGHAWKARYIDKVQMPTSPALVIGSAFHDAVESYVGGKQQDLETAWTESWARQLERNQVIEWGATTPELAQEDGLRMVRAKPVRTLVDTLRQNFDPETCEIEKRVELRVPGVPIPVIGYIDVITRDGIPGDFKTAARMWADNKASSELQPLFYLAALNQAGIAVPGWTFRHYVVSRSQHPTAKVFEVRRQPHELFWLFEMIKAAWRGIEHEVYPMNTNTWRCSPQYCDVWGDCRGKYAI